MIFLLKVSTISLKMKEMQCIFCRMINLIEGADRGAAVIVWDREDCLKEESKQLEDKEVYLEVPNDSSALVSAIFKPLEKIRKRVDLSQDTLNYFLVRDPKFARFYLLPRVHKRI